MRCGCPPGYPWPERPPLSTSTRRGRRLLGSPTRNGARHGISGLRGLRTHLGTSSAVMYPP